MEGEQRGERGGDWRNAELRWGEARCVGAKPGALGRLKRLTGLLIVNGSEPI